MGGKFAIWDLMFGTLIKSKSVKKIKFGLGKEDKDYNSFIKNILLSPLKNLINKFSIK